MPVEKPWLCKAGHIALRILAEVALQPQGLASSKKVALDDLTAGEETVIRGKAAADADRSRELFLHLDGEVHDVGLVPFGRSDLDLFKVIELLEPGDALLHLLGAEGIAFRQLQLTPDHFIPGFGVSGDINPSNVDQVPFFHVVGDVRRLILGVALHVGLDLHIRIALVHVASC